MPSSSALPLVAVDVGNSRVKLGVFARPADEPLPVPQQFATFDVNWSDTELNEWLAGDAAGHAWAIASVNRPAAKRLVEWLAQHGAQRVRLLTHADMPLAIDVTPPESVGLDRLADAVAANRLRAPDEPAIVVDHGSAITVNLVSAEGAFQGGAILPGIRMAARALHEFTDRLPLVDVTEGPQFLEQSTDGAIHFGLYWGAVGAVRELIARMTPVGGTPQVFLTGGGAPALSAILSQDNPRPPVLVPHLTLSGVALAAAHAAAKGRS